MPLFMFILDDVDNKFHLFVLNDHIFQYFMIMPSPYDEAK
jgi:hypothetical protein